MTGTGEILTEAGFLHGAVERLTLAAARSLRVGRLALRLPSGSRRIIEGMTAGPSAAVQVHRWRAVGRLVVGGGIGLGEGYVAGDWDTDDLTAVLALAGLNLDATGLLRGRATRRAARYLNHLVHGNSRRGARRNIAFHYDLGNYFYRLWLDESMAYSSALFARPGEDLAAAQVNKYRRIAELAHIRPDHRLLEIGCGWGGFATWLARTIGCRVTAVTISDAQYDFAAAEVQRLGLGERVTIRRQDYRDIAGRFDRIASIEMLEAVGERYWPVFFRKLHDCLAPGGQAALQVITIADRAFERYRHGIDFVQKHIFPGGMLPSPAAMTREIERAALVRHQDDGFGPHYADTLALWRQRFESAWPQIAPLGFDERFRRLWRFYLAYCEAGFRIGRVDVRQLVVQRP